ncbi:MAG: bifunctional homocysteine S-methyltransferase/methylenetetrahydrofolate reductase [Gemmatimonadota bacterium]|nr:bifunctional homocysteine S-methyltransferase/methylenetetrahydrofolate reductase [Gemmatimonadota bacterium]
MKSSLLEHLKSSLLVGDGAIGTMLYAGDVPLGVCYDEINRSQPNLVRSIHEEYVAAGAEFLETNTFGANRLSLAKHNFEHHVEEINRSGVELARQAAGDLAYVAGAVGPARGMLHQELSQEDYAQAYTEQITALAAAHPDAIILETFLKLQDLLTALEACRSVCDLPVICQLAVDQHGRTDDAFEVTDAFRQLRGRGADVVGINCRSGPKGLLDALSMVPLEEGLILSAFPNAGSPVYIDGRFFYAATPEYFSGSAIRLRDQGVRLIGGCCGTTPEHIRSIAHALKDQQVVTSKKVVRIEVRPPVQAVQLPTPPQAPTIVDLVRQRVTTIVELDPPRNLDFSAVVRGAQALKDAGADAITMADNSLAVTRISNMAIGQIVKQEVGLRPFLHISCRDSNLVGMQSHLLGLHALGIDHVLAVTGDPVKFGDQPGAGNVYDISSFELIRLIKQMNEGLAFSGRPLDGKTNFTVAAAFDPNGDNLDRRIKRLEKKIDAGADMIMTQPIFDPRQAKQLYAATKHLDFPIFLGVMPLVSTGNTEFLHNEVPGFVVTDDARARMARFGRGKKARREGIAIAREIMDAVLEYFNGLYLITAFNRYPMTVELTRHANGKRR